MTAIYPKDLFRTARSSVVRASCFVLMPFDSEFASVYNEIRNTLQSPELNLICRRADDFRRPHILEMILTNIFRSEYIVADLTGLNPNVFYELGVAHCIKEADKVVLLAQNIEAVPFDLRHLRCIVYDPTASGLRILHDELQQTFQESARDSFRFRVWEGKRFRFGRKLVGRNRNLFEVEVECAHVGYGAVKLLLHFTEHSVDATEGPVESQFLFGGVTIPGLVRQRTEQRIRSHAENHYAGKFIRLDIRFHGRLCYIDAFTEPSQPSLALLRALGESRQQYLTRLRSTPVHLCRLRYFGNEEKWSMAFYTYSHEKYEPCVFDTGSVQGTPEEAFDTAAVYLGAD